ncbi:hypothetical protein C0J52_02661 [Blattella germanica]|nr:hypothetical protein C0J52_02661 [Blattella germanica]
MEYEHAHANSKKLVHEVVLNSHDIEVGGTVQTNLESYEDISRSKVHSTHCLVCDTALDNITSYNIFGQLKVAEATRGSVFEKVGQVLSRNLHSILLHSEEVCARCLNLLLEYEQATQRLEVIRLDLVSKFDATASKHQSDCRKEPPKLVITEEGKVVDCTGKEKEPAMKRRRAGPRIIPNVAAKRYACSVCGKGFRAYSHRVEHMLIHLGEKPWSCGECNKTFRTKSALRVHVSKHSGNRPYVCPACGKSFMDRYYFEQHCRVHTGEKPFTCSFCQKPFARKKDLAIHTKSHTGEKPFECSSCNKTFAVKSRLNRHLRIHSGEKPHRCEYCDKSFARRDDYRVHVRLHTGERPFRCAICGRSFANQSNCLVHVRMHEGLKNRFSCTTCKESFDRRNKLDKHIAAQHGTESNKVQEALEPEVSAQPIISTDQTLQSLTVTDLTTLQAIPITQVAQLEWSDGIAGGTTTAYVNITPATYVNIL